ncbi:MAG: TonB-dependent receptor [Candidatus Binatia bacterium]
MRFMARAMGLGGALAALIVLSGPATGWAQAAKAPRPAGPKLETEVEEITVTAQKREESLQEVPISVTAITAETLVEKRASSVQDLTQSVPGVQVIPSSMGAGHIGMASRGVQQMNSNLAQNSKMGLYVDGVYIAKLLGNNLDLEDLERVEVLRGPQGTLFGRNTVVGAMQLVTRKPTEERSITAATEVGNYNAFKGRVTLNVPLIGKNGFWQSDVLGTISLRENVVYKHHDPYYDNRSPTDVPASGSAGFNNLNRVFNWTAVRWQPTKDITVDYVFEYHRYRDAPPAFQLYRIIPLSLSDANFRIPNTSIIIPSPFLPKGGLQPYVRKNRVDSIGNNATPNTPDLSGPTHRLLDDGNNRLNILSLQWDLGERGPFGDLSVKSINHYRNQNTPNNADLDGAPLQVFNGINNANLETWSTEEQLIGNLPRIHYVLGFNYYGERTASDADAVIFGGKVTNTHQFRTTWADSYAVFGQSTWTPPILWDKLSLTGGIRYNQDHVHAFKIYDCLGGSGCPPGASFRKSVGKDFGGSDAITYTGDASYQWTDNVMTYFRASKGWQSGVPNADATDPRLMNVVDPEKLYSYEVGTKSQWWNNRVRFNADMYYSKFKDQVVNTFQAGPSGAQVLLQNAGESTFWGAEVEATAIPLRGLAVDATYSYSNAKYDEFLEQAFDTAGKPVFDSGGNPVTVNVADFRDITLNPEHKFGIGATYTAPPFSFGTFSARVDMFWQDKQTIFTVPIPGANANRNVPGWDYAVVNGRLQLAEIPLQKGSLDISVFGRNLLDQKYRTWAIDFGDVLGFTAASYGDPRTFGIGLAYNFSEGAPIPAPPPVAQAAPPPATPAKKKIAAQRPSTSTRRR